MSLKDFTPQELVRGIVQAVKDNLPEIEQTLKEVAEMQRRVQKKQLFSCDANEDIDAIRPRPVPIDPETGAPFTREEWEAEQNNRFEARRAVERWQETCNLARELILEMAPTETDRSAIAYQSLVERSFYIADLFIDKCESLRPEGVEPGDSYRQY